jgi:hypothetical protein
MMCSPRRHRARRVRYLPPAPPDTATCTWTACYSVATDPGRSADQRGRSVVVGKQQSPRRQRAGGDRPRRVAVVNLRRAGRRGARHHCAHADLLPALQEWTDTDHAALADLGYDGENRRLTCPIKAGRGQTLTVEQRTVITLHSPIRALSERGNALFKTTFKALRRVSLCPWRIGAITAAPLVLLHINTDAQPDSQSRASRSLLKKVQRPRAGVRVSSRARRRSRSSPARRWCSHWSLAEVPRNRIRRLPPATSRAMERSTMGRCSGQTGSASTDTPSTKGVGDIYIAVPPLWLNGKVERSHRIDVEDFYAYAATHDRRRQHPQRQAQGLGGLLQLTKTRASSSPTNVRRTPSASDIPSA